jgi:hypothetical protein
MSPAMRRVWPLLALVLAGTCAFLLWQNARLRGRRVRSVDRPAATQAAAAVETEAEARPRQAQEIARALEETLPDTGDEEPPPVPRRRHWAVEFFSPKPGENLIAYRDRVLPVVQAAALPQRNRVARNRMQFEEAARLDEAQKRELDAAVDEAGEAIKDRIMQGVLSGEVNPRVKASTGVAFARDVLDLADGANRRFRASLRPDQQAVLDQSPFDVADYLFFKVRWEDMLGVTE